MPPVRKPVVLSLSYAELLTLHELAKRYYQELWDKNAKLARDSKRVCDRKIVEDAIKIHFKEREHVLGELDKAMCRLEHTLNLQDVVFMDQRTVFKEKA